jgi:hypothetical protein
MADPARHADPLLWGQGPRLFEMFLEPTCPYSVRAFGKIEALLETAGPERVTARIWLHSQPWHMFSGVIVRSILAASMLPGGRENAWQVLAEVGARREEFEFEKHCRGPNMDATPREIIARIEGYTGLRLAQMKSGDQEVLHSQRYARA